jgi:predicted DNA-binding transcriptional regulator YafY
MGLLLALRSGERCAAPDLALRFGVSRRTIYRDVEALSALGVPVYAERGRGGGIRLMAGYFLPPVTFTAGEAMSLALGLSILGNLRTVPFADDLASARRKLLAALPDDLRMTLAESGRLIGFERIADDIFHPEPETKQGEPPEGAEERALTGFARALIERRLVQMRYRSPYRPGEADIEATPLGLIWDRDRWYLVGRTGEEGQPRFWRADRVLRLTSGRAAPPAGGFDARHHLGRRWLAAAMRVWAREAPVRIAITPAQRERLGRDWYFQHADFEPLPDGRVLMRFGEDNPAIALALLRWLGPGAELIEPRAWRARLSDELAAMLASYRLPDQADNP